MRYWTTARLRHYQPKAQHSTYVQALLIAVRRSWQYQQRNTDNPVPDLRGGGRPPTNREPPTKPLDFWLMIDVSLVILIEDFEINEKLCTLTVSFQNLVNLCI